MSNKCVASEANVISRGSNAIRQFCEKYPERNPKHNAFTRQVQKAQRQQMRQQEHEQEQQQQQQFLHQQYQRQPQKQQKQKQQNRRQTKQQKYQKQQLIEDSNAYNSVKDITSESLINVLKTAKYGHNTTSATGDQIRHVTDTFHNQQTNTTQDGQLVDTMLYSINSSAGDIPAESPTSTCENFAKENECENAFKVNEMQKINGFVSNVDTDNNIQQWTVSGNESSNSDKNPDYCNSPCVAGTAYVPYYYDPYVTMIPNNFNGNSMQCCSPCNCLHCLMYPQNNSSLSLIFPQKSDLLLSSQAIGHLDMQTLGSGGASWMQSYNYVGNPQCTTSDISLDTSPIPPNTVWLSLQSAATSMSNVSQNTNTTTNNTNINTIETTTINRPVNDKIAHFMPIYVNEAVPSNTNHFQRKRRQTLKPFKSSKQCCSSTLGWMTMMLELDDCSVTQPSKNARIAWLNDMHQIVYTKLTTGRSERWNYENDFNFYFTLLHYKCNHIDEFFHIFPHVCLCGTRMSQTSDVNSPQTLCNDCQWMKNHPLHDDRNSISKDSQTNTSSCPNFKIRQLGRQRDKMLKRQKSINAAIRHRCPCGAWLKDHSSYVDHIFHTDLLCPIIVYHLWLYLEKYRRRRYKCPCEQYFHNFWVFFVHLSECQQHLKVLKDNCPFCCNYTFSSIDYTYPSTTIKRSARPGRFSSSSSSSHNHQTEASPSKGKVSSTTTSGNTKRNSIGLLKALVYESKIQ